MVVAALVVVKGWLVVAGIIMKFKSWLELLADGNGRACLDGLHSQFVESCAGLSK
ncbi:hypothetical protein LguiA_022455 [Lonicera macranthoides]